MGQDGIRFVRWFPTGEGASFFVAPFADSIHINWVFGDGLITSDGADIAAGKRFGFRPYYYSRQTLTVLPHSRYRLSLRAKVTGDQVLRAQVHGDQELGFDVCSTTNTYHPANGEACTYRDDDWRDYEVIVNTGSSAPTILVVALRGLYVSADAPSPFDNVRQGTIRVHSIQLQRDETGRGDWGGNLLTRSDPDTYGYVDQQSAAKLDEILRQSEIYGVYHKLPLFHRDDPLLGSFLPDGTVGDWDVDHLYAAEDQASRWYQRAYVRYFIARWSYSPSLHSLEYANENYLGAQAQDAAFAIAEYVGELSPRHILMSNSFYGYWVDSFWTDPDRGHLMDYSDQHWYANETGDHCDDLGERCKLISNVWDDSAAYVRECWQQSSEYRETFDYHKPIVRGEGGVAVSGTGPLHPDILLDPAGIYYHKKLWAHVGILGTTCDGEWYPRLFVGGGAFPNDDRDLGTMFAAYERFLVGEQLSNGRYVEIGSDLADGQHIDVTEAAGDLRAWGVQDPLSGRTLLWVDNATHTWKAVVDGMAILPSSGTLTLQGYRPGHAYTVEWWDPYAADPGQEPGATTVAIASVAGTLSISIEDLEHDIALKVHSTQVTIHRCYLPLAIRAPLR
jgi:hypothetical protein